VPSTPITTAPIRPVAPRRVPEALRVAAFVGGLLVVELILAHGAVGVSASKYLILLVGVAAVAFVLRFPMATALVYFLLTDFIFYPLKFAHQVGPLNIRPYEVALVLLLLIAAARPKRRTWGGTAGAALAAFYVLLSLSTLIAMLSGDLVFKTALDWARPFALLAMFWVIVRLFPERREREILLTGAAVIAAVTGVIALLISVGAPFGESLQEEAGNTVREQGTLDRVRLPGLSASYALFWYAAVQVANRVGKARIWWAVLFAGIALNIAVSFNRNMWVGVLLGFVVILMAAGTRLRKQMLYAMVLLATAITVFVLIGGAAGNETIAPVIERGETLIHPSKTAGESSLLSRQAETEIAFEAIKEHPVFGVGPGVPFGVFITEAVRTGSGEVIGFTHTPQLFLHDQYLYLILVAGIPGLIAFVIFLGTPVVLALRRRRNDLSTLACAVGIGMIMVSGFVAIYFSVVDMTAMLGLLAGVVIAGIEDP
jgi:O-antigen ligase